MRDFGSKKLVHPNSIVARSYLHLVRGDLFNSIDPEQDSRDIRRTCEVVLDFSHRL